MLVVAMPSTRLKPVCGVCGDRIGVYEPIWLALDDGTLVASALLNLDDHRARIDGDPRLFHIGCFEQADDAPLTILR
jgi:hypothetical protein